MSSQRPLVTIITINFNQLQHTLDLLKSLRKVTYPNFETIVVDNCSKVNPYSEITTQYPEVKKLIDAGVHREQYTFRLDGSEMDKIFRGSAPTNDGTELVTLTEPRNSYPNPIAPERPEEFAPGLDPELQAMADALDEFKEKTLKDMEKKAGPNPRNKKK